MSVFAQDGRRRRHDLLGGRVGAGGEELEQLGRGEVRRRPLGHEQGRVALIDRLAGEELVALVEDAI